MNTINVKTNKSYDIIVGEDILGNILVLLDKFTYSKVMIVTDSVVSKLYVDKLYKIFKTAGKNVFVHTFKSGERSKNFNTYNKIINDLANNEFTREDLVLAVGGGVVGDIAGFAASTYMRGIKYVQVPTTLLAQVDSSVGGKTAIDLPQGKNLVGTFYQPSMVICDVSTLSTLKKEVYLDGMGEVAKYGILDKEIYNLIVADAPLTKILTACITYKKNIVEVDEFESGDRKLLNLGHTVAHAIEKLSNYSIPHGTAVGMGLKVVIDSAVSNGYVDESQRIKIMGCIEKCVGKTTCPYGSRKLAKCMAVDKKRKEDSIDFVAIHGIGDVKIEEVKLSNMKRYLG